MTGSTHKFCGLSTKAVEHLLYEKRLIELRLFHPGGENIWGVFLMYIGRAKGRGIKKIDPESKTLVSGAQ